MKKKNALRMLAIATLLAVIALLDVSAYCVDRKCPERPNTGYCTIFQGAYHCIPGGVTCDGDEEHGPVRPCLE